MGLLGFIRNALHRNISCALSSGLNHLLTGKLSTRVADASASASLPSPPPTTESSTPDRVENLVVANLFVATIFAMALIGLSMAFSPCPTYSQLEKRKLTAFPVIDTQGEHIYKFASQFEGFYNDHFPVRLPLTSFENTLNYRLFHATGRPICAFGNKDWLIYTTGQLPTAQQNLNQLNEDQLHRWHAMYQARHDILASKNIKYVLVIAPEKGTIYPEFMPTGWSRRPGYSRMEQLQSALRISNVDFVNASGLLSESKRVGKWLYFSNDTHWNNYGAFQIAQALFTLIGKDFEQIHPFALNQFELKDSKHIGDLAIALTLQNMLADTKSPTVEIKKHETNVQQSHQKLSVIREADSEVIEEPVAFEATDSAYPRAFVQHDSFMAFLRPYLAEKFSFSEYHAVHTFAPQVVFASKPDIVIDEIAERHLYDRSPESVPVFIKNTAPDELNISFGDRLLLKSLWSKWTREGLQIQMLWQTKGEQSLDTTAEVATTDGNISTAHNQDFYQRKLPSGAQFVDTFILPLTSNSLDQEIQIRLKSSAGKDATEIGRYQFKLQQFQNKKSPVESLASSYSCPGETFK